MVSLFKLNTRKKGTLIVAALLGNLDTADLPTYIVMHPAAFEFMGLELDASNIQKLRGKVSEAHWVDCHFTLSCLGLKLNVLEVIAECFY